jgi:NAD-dependent SIR2 family protein deacetylase
MDCHKPPNLGTKLIDANFAEAPLKCEECHADRHGHQFARADFTPCADCHNSAKWKPSLFDHDKRTAFSLQGAHRAVRCEACHKATRVISGKTVLFYKPTPKECADCHGATVPVS